MKWIVVILMGAAASALAQDVQTYYAAGQQAFKDKDYGKAYEKYQEAYKLYPYSSRLNYQLGLAAAMSGHLAEALVSLKKAVLAKADFELQNKEELASLKNDKGFAALLLLQKNLQTPIVQSDTAFVLKDRTLHIECIAFDASTQKFYLGSIHQSKIVEVDRQVKVRDFITSGDHGIPAVFGVKIDARRHQLWASASPVAEMEHYDSTASSGVYQYDLVSGKLLQYYEPDYKTHHFILGDLTLNLKGEVFVSDTQNNVIFKVNESSHRLEAFFESSEFVNIQGITFSDNDQYLFIADYVKGIFRLDMQTKKLIRLEVTFEQSLAGVDGLTFYKNSLIAVQNGVSPSRATRYYLNSTSDRLEKFSILDRHHPAFGEPTSGTLTGNQFYYVANSQWEAYADDHSIKPNDQLQDIVVLRAVVGR